MLTAASAIVLLYLALGSTPGQALPPLPVSALAGQVEAGESGQPPDSLQGEPISAGFLIQSGQYVAPPYVVSFESGRLQINGLPLPTSRDISRFPHDLHGDAPSRSRRTPAAAMGRLERQLSHGLLIVWHSPDDVLMFQEIDAVEVMRVLCSSLERSEKVASLLRLPEQEFDSRQWGLIIDAFHPTEELKSRLKQLDELYRIQSAGLSIVHAGVSRSQLYALTVVGMVLIVLSFGTILSFQPAYGQRWRDEDRSSAASRIVLRCLVLLSALSAFDLLCTILGGSTDRFQELNPLARTLLADPSVLIGFKAALTGLAVLILWRLRFYRGTQIASWWLCLLLTLLTVRWVAVESLLMA